MTPPNTREPDAKPTPRLEETNHRPDIADPAEEIRKLRADVVALRQSLESRLPGPVEPDQRAWLKIAASVGLTFALGKVIQLLRLPSATAVAVPMVVSELNRRIL